MLVANRKTAFGVLIAGVTGGLLFLPAIYFVGLAVAPPPPVPAITHVRPLIADAIWARANGGSATELTPVTTFTLARFAACIAIEDFKDTTPGDARRVEACRGYLPAIQGLEYLSSMHLRDANLRPSFHEGISRFATTIWVTRSWSKTEVLDTLAARGEFAFGWRGVETAARGYFGRSPADLALPEAALLAALLGDRRADPWCDPEAAARMRRRILQRMRDNLAIDDAAAESANVSEIKLAPPPADHNPCGG